MTLVFPDCKICYLNGWITRLGPKRILIVEIYFWFWEKSPLQFFLVGYIQLKLVTSESDNAYNILGIFYCIHHAIMIVNTPLNT